MSRYVHDAALEVMAIQAASMEGEGLRTVRLTPWGRVKSANGEFVIDDEAADSVIDAFKAHGVDLPVDFDHETINTAGRAPAAGWISKLWKEPGRGLFALIRWNPEARDAIRGNRYRYLSPVLALRPGDRRVVAVHSAALTNKPAIPGMERLAASARLFGTETLTMADEPKNESEGQPEAEPESATQLLAKIAKALRIEIKSDMTAEDVLRAIFAKVKGDKGPEGIADAQVAASVRDRLGLEPDAGASEVTLALSLLERRGDATVGQADRERAANELVENYVAIGKINPRDEPGIEAAMSLARENPDRLRALMANAKSVLPPQGKTQAPRDMGTLKRTQVIRLALRDYLADELLQAQTTRGAFVALALREADLPELADGELTQFV